MNIKLDDALRTVGLLLVTLSGLFAIVVAYPPSFGEERSSRDPAFSLESALSSHGFEALPEIVSARLANSVTIYQGMRVVTAAGIECSLGYLDVDNHVAFLARHCFGTQDVAEIEGMAVGAYGVKIGTVASMDDYRFHNPELDAVAHADVDIAVISLVRNVTLGGNLYSGDPVVPYGQLRLGARVCTFGATSQVKICGRIVAKQPEARKIYIAPDRPGLTSKNGDSGGPVWQPGVGIVGVHGGSFAGNVGGVVRGEYAIGF